MSGCILCPRSCGADRTAGQLGVCGQSAVLRIARAACHPWEEPSVSGTKGSGTVFFSGCNLGCVYCQNTPVSHRGQGYEITPGELANIMLRLRDEGAHNINLVTPTHFTDVIADVLRDIKPKLGIPVIYNCGGYELPRTLRLLDGLVDVFLPDFKYVSRELSAAYSGAPDYSERATAALRTMYDMVGEVAFDGNGLIRRGVIVRHLVLPGCRNDSLAVLHRIAKTVPVGGIRLSLMSQYTPEFAADCAFRNLHRRVTTFEYQTVLEEAQRIGFQGYFQRRSSATGVYTPEFYGEESAPAGSLVTGSGKSLPGTERETR